MSQMGHIPGYYQRLRIEDEERGTGEMLTNPDVQRRHEEERREEDRRREEEKAIRKLEEK